MNVSYLHICKWLLKTRAHNLFAVVGRHRVKDTFFALLLHAGLNLLPHVCLAAFLQSTFMQKARWILLEHGRLTNILTYMFRAAWFCTSGLIPWLIYFLTKLAGEELTSFLPGRTQWRYVNCIHRSLHLLTDISRRVMLVKQTRDIAEDTQRCTSSRWF